MRTLIASVLSASLLASAAMAADTVGPLVAGKPAGVRQAQGINQTALIVITGIVAAGVAIGLGTASSGNPGGPVPLTTVPSTTVVAG
jgi:opacity protein-like surface antigen